MGVHKNIESPEKLWEYFLAYKEKTKDSPIEQHDYVGKDADEVWRKKERPLTMEGFYNYCDDNGIITTLDHYFMNYEKRYEDFVGVCSRIRRSIRQDQIEGGMAGIYNPSITQRLNGLVDKAETKTESVISGKVVVVKQNPSGVPLSNRETDVDTGS